MAYCVHDKKGELKSRKTEKQANKSKSVIKVSNPEKLAKGQHWGKYIEHCEYINANGLQMQHFK